MCVHPTSPYFKQADDTCFWLFRKWVVTILCYVSGLLTYNACLWLPVCQWLLCDLLVSSLLMIPVLCPLVCKWQSHLAHYKSAYDAYCQLLACEQLAFHISSLLTAHIHGSLGSKWLSYLTFQACWQCCLSRMWGCCILWYFKPAYNSGSWLSSLWVVAIPCCIFSFVYNTCLYLSLWVAAIPFFSSYKPVYFMTLQLVSGCHFIPKLAYNASSWFGRMWVVALSPCILSLLIMHS